MSIYELRDVNIFFLILNITSIG